MLPLLWLALAAQPKPLAQYSEREFDALIQQVRTAPDEGDRVARASEAFLGTPYKLGCLGEGQGRDPDPTIRFDQVDRVTFVEETLALTRAHSYAEAKDLLQKIRYRGDTVDYAERNHFVEADWVPNNARKGFVKEITAEVAGKDTVYLARHFGLEQWHRRSDARDIDLPDANAPVGDFKLPILPVARAAAHEAQMPNGAIILVVHSATETQSNRVGHLGLVIRKNGRVYIRHASSTRKRVIEEPLQAFVDGTHVYKRWPVVGFSFVKPLADAAETAAR